MKKHKNFILEWEETNLYDLMTGEQLLYDLNGSARSGEVIGVFESKDSHENYFIDFLSNHVPPRLYARSSLKINGAQMTLLEFFKYTDSTFQGNFYLAHLTVKEFITY